MTEAPAPSPAAAPPAAPSSTAAGMAAAAAAGALYLDAVVETFAAGSPVRWWTVVVAALYAAATASTWRMRVSWHGRLAAGVLGLLGLIALTAWGPGGLTDGIRLFGQPTGRVLATLAAAGVALAGLTIVRVPALPLAARVGVGVVAAYGAGAFLAGAAANTAMTAIVGGQSFWQALPRVLQGGFIGAFIVLPVGLVWSVVRAGLRRPREATWRAELWRGTALAASLATVLAGLPLRSVGSPSAPPPAEDLASRLGIDPTAPKLSDAELETALTNSLRAIEDGERDVPRDRWDPAYVAEALGPDPQQVFAWVQSNTAWIPYKGLLRGPVGVLLDRQGNSLDRALLLATLLRQPGRSVRLAHGTLPEAAVWDPLRAAVLARYGDVPIEPEGEGNALAAVAAQYQLDEAAVRGTLTAQADSWARKRAVLLERAPEQARRLAQAVGPPPDTQTAALITRAIDALRDHWWVQVLEGGLWQDFDLLGGSAGAALTSPEQTFDPEAIPDELRHRVTLRVIGEQWSNGALVERPALERTLRLARHVGTPITLRFIPANWPKTFPPANMSPAQGLRALALGQPEWTPVLVVGKDAHSQSAIRASGDLGAGPEATGGGGLSGFGRALEDALGPSGSTAAAPSPQPVGSNTLTAAFIEYEILSPGQGPRKIRRAVFDLIGPAARAAKPVAAPKLDETALLTRSLALMMETEILPVVSRFTPEFVIHLGAQSVLANREILTSALRGELRNDFAGAQELATRLAPAPTPLYGLALARFEGSRFGGLVHIDRPNILTRHTYFASAPKGFKLVVATDIVANDVGVDLAVDDPFAVRLEQGVLDTNAEALMASERPDGSNAGWAYASPGSWTTVKSVSDPALAALRLPDDSRRRIEDDLAAGYIVVAPTSPVPIGTSAFAGWWRIDPASGQALGMSTEGRGQAMTEFLITVGWAFAIGFMFQYLLCQMLASSEGLVARGCDGSGTESRWALGNPFVTPVHAAGGECAMEGLFAGLLGGLMAGAGFGLGKWLGGGGLKGGKANPAGKGQADPFGKPEPGMPGGGQPGPPGGRAAGPASSGGRGGSGTGPGGAPGVESGRGMSSAEFEALVKAEENAFKAWQSKVPPYEQVKGGMTKDELFRWSTDLPEYKTWNKAFQDMANYWKSSASPGGKPLPSKPPVGLSADEWGAINKAADASSKAPPSPGAGSGAKQTTPPDPNAPTLPGTGPHGTQIIPPAPKSADPYAATLPGTGPGGTQIIPPAPKSADPNAATLPGTGPGGTQIIPPGPKCPGPACPPTAQQKTLTGLGGVANALGQKIGG